MDRGLSQAKVAAGVGIAPSTVSNMESSNFLIVSEERAAALATFFGLDAGARRDLLAAWKELPVSEYTKTLRATWEKRNQQRSKVRHHDRMMLSLCEILAVTFAAVDPADPGTLCICVFDDFGAPTPGTGKHPSDPTRPCELCYALQALGLEGWTNYADVSIALAALQEELEERIRAKAKPVAKP
jgi:transcriptional regulator with XRE-family HTH domain